MSKISKYLQITQKLLLEYTYDINASADAKNLDAYVVKDNSGRVTFLNNPTEKNVGDYYTSGFMFTAFPKNKKENSYLYSGYTSAVNNADAVDSSVVDKLSAHGFIDAQSENRGILAHSTSIDVPMERIRIYLATGYTFNDSLGFILNVRCRQSSNAEISSTNHEINLHTFTFVRGMISTLARFAEKPFYQQNKFYDRYIEFYIPSAYYMANHKTNSRANEGLATNIFDTLNIDYGNQIKFNFATIEEDSFIDVAADDNGYIDFFTNTADAFYSDQVFYNQGSFSIGDFVEAEITLNSNSDNFNLRLYEDKEMNCVRYYPVWGESSQDRPLTRKIMNSIENGSIPMSMSGFYDDNDSDIDDFEAIYGEEARKWIVVNQLEIQFVYQPIVSSNNLYDNEIRLSRKFNYTEDFETDNDNIGNVDNLYKYLYRPVIESLNNGYVCNYISVTYTGRLVNRLNGEEIIRTATLDIDNAEAKFGVNSNKIDVSNIYTWKLFNKYESESVAVSGASPNVQKTKYVTKFVNSQNFAMQSVEDGANGTSGNFVIRLYDTEHLYKMCLFVDDTYIEPYQFGDANVSVLMRVNSGESNTPMFLKPTYSSDMNSVVGELEFRISESLANSILKGDRKWHLVAQAETGITTLFAGKFESVFGDE